VIGGERLSLAGATLLNGYLVTAVTMCDVHRPTLTQSRRRSFRPLGDRRAGRPDRPRSPGRLGGGFEAATRVGIGLDYQAFRARGCMGRA